MAYVTREELRDRLSGDESLGSEYDDRLDDLIGVCQKAVDTYTGRVWESPASAARFYVPTVGSTVLDIDDAQSVTEVAEKSNGTWTALAASDWSEWPGGPPTDRLIRETGYWQRSLRGPSVRVTGVFATTATVPDDVKEATMILASRLFARPDSATGVEGGGIETGLFFVMRNDPDFQALLQFRRRLAVAG